MSSKTRLDRNVDRREFLKAGVAAAIASLAAGSGIVAAGERSTDPKSIPTRRFGKTPGAADPGLRWRWGCQDLGQSSFA